MTSTATTHTTTTKKTTAKEAEATLMITTSEGVLAAVRARGWTDPLWTEVGRLRHDADAARIFNTYAANGGLRFPGEVLQALMNLVPYPVPANRSEDELAPVVAWTPTTSTTATAEEGEEDAPTLEVHPGPWNCMNVTGLPEALRVAELNTSWGERPEFALGARPPSAAFARLLDQIALGSPSMLAPSALRGDLTFPPPFAVEAEHVPWVTLARLSQTFPEALALEILRDWGLILRRALGSLDALAVMEHRLGVGVGVGGNRRIPRSVLARSYERAVLRWMVQRLAFERLR